MISRCICSRGSVGIQNNKNFFIENPSRFKNPADDFTSGRGFTFTVPEPVTDDVIGCVYLYPSSRAGYDVTVQSWVRADRADLDGPLATAVADWLATAWPWEHPDRCGR